MSNKFMKAIASQIRDIRISDGYYDGRYSTKSVPNKRTEFLADCDDDLDEYLQETKDTVIKPSPHRL